MATRLTLLVTLLAAAGLIAFTPHLAMAPGALVPGHAQLTGDCLACHSPFTGVADGRCVACHALEQIGADAGTGALGAFHVTLGPAGCSECHPEHARRGKQPFTHDALPPGVRARCGGCHHPPADEVHAAVTEACDACHTTRGWTGATFDHTRVAERPCTGCHERRRPADELHRGADDCGACHGTDAWKPASFDHAKFFALDGDHRASCATCHEGPGYRTYTCYGCHEHTRANVEHEHVKEGIRDFQDCARCHRSGEEGEGGEHGGERGKREHGRREHDDD